MSIINKKLSVFFKLDITLGHNCIFVSFTTGLYVFDFFVVRKTFFVFSYSTVGDGLGLTMVLTCW